CVVQNSPDLCFHTATMPRGLDVQGFVGFVGEVPDIKRTHGYHFL
ncbi:MAG: hypothetical protein JWQ55_558, partial [Rhodopila sp.]|nr:hypothetical protein [Rhodopila sp.]